MWLHQLPGMKMLIDNIEWLENVRSVQREAKGDDSVIIAEIEELFEP